MLSVYTTAVPAIECLGDRSLWNTYLIEAFKNISPRKASLLSHNKLLGLLSLEWPAKYKRTTDLLEHEFNLRQFEDFNEILTVFNNYVNIPRRLVMNKNLKLP